MREGGRERGKEGGRGKGHLVRLCSTLQHVMCGREGGREKRET